MRSIKGTFKLSNGTQIPCIGFGTWQSPEGKTTVDAVKYALEAGYRHIDTAAVYKNEKSVGKAIAESGVRREEIFVTSKLWNTERGYEPALRAFGESLTALDLDYLDLYLIHWPSNTTGGGRLNSETWRAFEKLYGEGLIRAIGVSNFLVHHLEALLATAHIVPMVNQIEFHPGQMQSDVLGFCRARSILIEAWSPLGTGRMLDNPELQEIAAKYGKSVAQLCIRWCLQNGTLPLPKSVTPSRISENCKVFDFAIDQTDMDAINAMPYFGGSGLHPDSVKF